MPQISIDEFNKIAGPEVPFVSYFGARLLELEAGKATVIVPFNEKFIRPGGTISGPVIMTAADLVMYAVVMSLIGSQALAVTTNLNINFLRKPGRKDIIARGSVLKHGKRLVVAEVLVYSKGDDRAVAHITGTYSIPPEKS